MSAGTKTGWTKGLRKEQRIPACKPVTVSGQDVFGNPFSQNTFTVEVAACGARLRGLPPVAPDSILLLECGEQRAYYRVVWVGEKGGKHEGHVGLECLEHDKSPFGIDPPRVGQFYDEYKRVEAELHRSDDRYKHLFENSLGLICTHDLQGALLSINPAAAHALGYESDEGSGKNLTDFLAPSVRIYFPAYLQRIRDRGEDSGYMLIVARNRGKHVWLYRNMLIHEDGFPPYVLFHAMDITEQKTIEHELQSTLKELEKALAEIKTLRGLLSICAWCKRIRSEDGSWIDLETYVTKHSDASFSHSICPECVPKLRSCQQ
jgi:PAS domain S-box-containing protein